MVTKLLLPCSHNNERSVLAKIHMVTKHCEGSFTLTKCSVLAKIHMVTKPHSQPNLEMLSSVLAKIHMVTKL